MNTSTLTTLAETPPRKFLTSVRDANFRIAELETALAAQTRLAQLAAHPAPEAALPVAAKPEPTWPCSRRGRVSRRRSSRNAAGERRACQKSR